MTTIAHSPPPSLAYPNLTPHTFDLTQPPAVDSEGGRADGPGETRLPEPHEGLTHTASSDVSVRRGEATGDLMVPISEGAGAKAEEETVPTRVASELDIAIWREFKEDNYESELSSHPSSSSVGTMLRVRPDRASSLPFLPFCDQSSINSRSSFNGT
jgi:hypothetical protein